MGFLSHRRRDIEVNPEQKWDFISLNDFKSTSCFTPFAYAFLWFGLFISLAVYVVDIFTAYQLLAFNKWSSQIEPAQFVPFDISKWIFTVCIILSFVNLAYEYFRALAIMRRGSVAECFLDSLAARIECFRMGSGRGWRRFLVFAELTKSKKGAEYIALFTFFSFQSWIRTLLCSGPRQVINALTLYSVYNAKLQINEANFGSSLTSFFDKIRALATEEPQQAVILSGMLFTLVIWVFSFLSLLLAALFFVFFLWSYIPREDGGLTGFCERKVNKRLKQIVAKKINKAMADQERKRKKAELKAAKKNGDDRPMTMKPSLPVLADDGLPEMPSIKRADTFASFTEKPSRPTTPGSFEMNALGRKPPMPSRSDTKLTATSQYSSNASLLNSAADMGMAPSESATPTLPPFDLEGYPPARTATSASNRSYGPNPAGSQFGFDGRPPLRTATSSSNRSYGPGPQGSQLQRMASNGSSLRGDYTASPAPYSSETMPSLPPPVLSPVGSFNNYRGAGPNQPRDRLPYPGDNRSPFDDDNSGRASPAPTYRSNPMSPRGMGPDGYPIRSATAPVPPRGPDGYLIRSNTNPVPVLGPDGFASMSNSSSNTDPVPVLGPDGFASISNSSNNSNTDPVPVLGPDGFATMSNSISPPELDGFPVRSTATPAPTEGPKTNNYPIRTATPQGLENNNNNNDSYPMRSTPTPGPGPGPSRGPAPTPGPGPGPYPVRSATAQLPPRGPPSHFPPPRSMTQPFHQPTGSNASSQRSAPSYQPYHQQSASGSSLRNMVNAVAYGGGGDEDEGRGEGSGQSQRQRQNPMTASRGMATGGYGNGGSGGNGNGNGSRDGSGGYGSRGGNGWNEDLERGGGRY